jgi:hypothetical protein
MMGAFGAMMLLPPAAVQKTTFSDDRRHPEARKLVVSGKIKEKFENGRDYYALEGRELRPPVDVLLAPAQGYLRYHAEHRFRG